MQHFKFSRESQFFPDYAIENFEHLKDWNVYELRQDNGWNGRFLYHRKVCYFEYEDKQYGITPRRSLFRKTEAFIVDKKTNSMVGSIKVKHTLGGNVGEVQLGNDLFKASWMTSDKHPTFLNQDGISYHKYGLSNSQTKVVYDFQFWHTFDLSIDNINDGDISLSGDDPLPVFAGIFLVQEHLNHINRK